MAATFPSPQAARRPPIRLADVAVVLGSLALLALAAKVGAGMLVGFKPPVLTPHVSLDPRVLPYYAARSTLRMFIALLWSLAFTFAYGYAAARSRLAGRVLIPLLDILQSVPVLGFLSITVTGFIALFPGSLLGLEFAAIFAIFTAQAWNMAFSFYQSLLTVPKELSEAAELYRFSGWQRFLNVELPWAAIPLVWNAMMSFGGGWFFLAASEAISVLNQKYTLPGIGSYVAAAVDAKDLHALVWAAIAIAIVIVIVDQLFWRPMVAWADKFRFEQSASANPPRSWVLDLIRAADLPALLGRMLRPAGDAIAKLFGALTAVRTVRRQSSRLADVAFNVGLGVVTLALIILIARFVLSTVGLGEVLKAIGLGFATMARVIILVAIATLIWTPVGVAIGLNPRLAQLMQPVVQFFASFPANFVFPFATIAFIAYHIPINWGCVLLMALGSQWYILFNTIAGAQGIPTELREMADDIGLRGWTRWKRLIIPGIFGSWVTGALTASGGAWNASIVSEIVSWGSTTLTAVGLGTYISEATGKGDWPRIALGVSIMALFVVIINRVFWRRLYRLAETRFA
ncbi:MAG: ABC transporter permease subunit [Candidatus Eremiobacteraeota bacterium]|nr:ABC transporter permease subunit [Candidatus Eremiobacteraeota bacterium]MBV8366131.1 ABC transporter permease subunit [Candidatus Eremiobacteraeota bacterium]